MIVSASYRTDIPAFYGRWFRQRLRAGFCKVANPYGGPPSTVPLTIEAVDGFVFWTRNAGPFLDVLREVRATGFPFVVQFTVTGYPRALEASVIAAGQATDQIRAIADEFGPRAVVWRYDPILASSLTPESWHIDTFGRLAEGLAGAVDEVIVSFARIYRKTARNLDRAAREAGFSWNDPPADGKRRLLAELAAIAGAHRLRLAVCAQPDLIIPGTAEARCIDPQRLSFLAGRPIGGAGKAHRPCGCAASRDIGAYDSCPQGCAYCYAVGSRRAAMAGRRRHAAEGEFLVESTVGN